MTRPFVLVLDHGTTGLKVGLLDRHGTFSAQATCRIPALYPRPGWTEQDPMALWHLTRDTLTTLFRQAGCGWEAVHTIGMTNQRETAIVWDQATGQPIYNAIVWQCRRTADICQRIKADPDEARDIHARTGLVVDAYFSATKIQWILQHVATASALLREERLRFGTVDSWLLWHLTGGRVHATDMTNASRTMLFHLRDKAWDPTLLKRFGVPETMLPEVKTSATVFGTTDPTLTGGHAIPIGSLIGDQQSALYGQRCWTPGTCKSTYGTGAFLMMNLGDRYLASETGLLTTLACDASGQPCYALEGAVFIAGAALEWLKESLALFETFDEADGLAQSVPDNAGVYFVPAFVGLGAPYWNSDVRGLLTGLTQGAQKAHLVRAAFEAMAYQTRDVLQLMQTALGQPITGLNIDGGVTRSGFLNRFLADILEIPVYRQHDTELTGKGAGFLAGLATGFWASPEEIAHLVQEKQGTSPAMASASRKTLYQGWQHAVTQACLDRVCALHTETIV